MNGDIGETDRRAVVAGALAGAVVTFAVIALGEEWANMAVVAAVVASVPAGTVAVYASRERMQPFREGAFAALAGFLVGVGTWMVLVSVVNPAHPLDYFLLLVPPAFVVVSLGFLVSFAVGGVSGYTTLKGAL